MFVCDLRNTNIDDGCRVYCVLNNIKYEGGEKEDRTRPSESSKASRLPNEIKEIGKITAMHPLQREQSLAGYSGFYKCDGAKCGQGSCNHMGSWQFPGNKSRTGSSGKRL